MINRRGAASAARNSDDDLVVEESNKKTPGGALKDVPILPEDRQKRRKLQRLHKKKKSSWRMRPWIPFCFVIFYLVIVIVGLMLLIKFLLFSSSSKSKTSTTFQQFDPAVGTSVTMTSPLDLDYPTILRKISQQEYPVLSNDVIDMCTHTLWHTIETTTIVLPDGETFVHTGDIDDLWLRDSAAQIHPLLVPVFGVNRTTSLIALDSKLDRIVAGLIARTATYIRHDPYANAFRIDDSYVFSAAQKKLGRHDLISTWNYELDSGCFWIRMVYYYWKQSPHGTSPTNSNSILVQRPQVQEAAIIMVDVWAAEQKHELDDDEQAVPRGPLFDCINCNKPYRYPGLPRNGKGSPTNASSGLTWTGFRPSDDPCHYGFLVPANMFAVVALEYIVEMATHLWQNMELAQKAQQLAIQIQHGIETHAIIHHPVHGRIYAYEVDGLGNALLMDDANVPSLLSIPYLGYRHYDKEVYANTKRFIFSNDNPTYQSGNNPLTGPIAGYGSPHMKAAIEHNIWPMSLAVQGLTRYVEYGGWCRLLLSKYYQDSVRVLSIHILCSCNLLIFASFF
jgi:uncharacterized protein